MANLPTRRNVIRVTVKRKRQKIPPGIAKQAKRAYKKPKPGPGKIIDFEA